jgi:hypothetical protein
MRGSNHISEHLGEFAQGPLRNFRLLPIDFDGKSIAFYRFRFSIDGGLCATISAKDIAFGLSLAAHRHGILMDAGILP